MAVAQPMELMKRQTAVKAIEPLTLTFRPFTPNASVSHGA